MRHLQDVVNAPRQIAAAAVMAALWPALKLLEAWAYYADRQNRRRGQ